MVGKCEWLSIVLSAFGDYIRWRRFQAPNAALAKTASAENSFEKFWARLMAVAADR